MYIPLREKIFVMEVFVSPCARPHGHSVKHMNAPKLCGREDGVGVECGQLSIDVIHECSRSEGYQLEF